MANVCKTVLLIQPSPFQGQIWRNALTSQGIKVIWETSGDFEPIKYLNHLDTFQEPLPNAICLEVGESGVEAPYGFCRWCSDHYPQIKLILTNSDQSEVSELEQQWARVQGAKVIFARTSLENLLPTMMSQVNLVLTQLDEPALRGTELLMTLEKTLHLLKDQSLITEAPFAKAIKAFPNQTPRPNKAAYFWSKLRTVFKVS